jgi:hypothetical protein
VKHTTEYVIEEIEKFLNGTGGAYDWDDFTSIPIRDPHLNSIRIECAELRESYPPTSDDGYCGHEGLDRLREILDGLKKNK